MKTNENGIDRTIRVLAGGGLVAAAFLALDVTAAAPLGIAAAAVGAILLITGLVGFCPAYGLCKLSTCKAA